MRYQVFLFDFDYTLADATPAIVDCANYALGKLNMEPKPQEEIRRTVGLTLRETFSTLTGARDEQMAEKFLIYYMELADRIMTERTALFPDTAETLSRLKSQNGRTAIVTSKIRCRIEDALRRFGLTELIDYIVGVDDVAEAKPSPEGLLKAARHFSAGKRDVLYTGDSYIDANAAARAGVDFAGVTTGTTSAADFAALPHVFIGDGLTELMAYIDGRPA